MLRVTRATAGCIFLLRPNLQGLEMMTGRDSSVAFRCRNSESARANCACHKVMVTRQTGMVNDASQCPLLADAAWRNKIGCFACIPLKSKDRALGVMNIACLDGEYFTENDFRLFDSIGYHVGMAVENSILYGEAREKEELRGQLLNNVISAQEEERKRISRELHDEAGQTLTAAIMNIESVENLVPPRETELTERVRYVKSLVAQTLEDIRRLTHDLRPSALDDLGLVSAIRAYVKNHLETHGIHVEFESKGLIGGRRLAPPIETALFRIVQEATNNILRHAEAHNVRIGLIADEGTITAAVEDDGAGFDVDAVFNNPAGRGQSLGLLGIQERAKLLGGTFEIQSRRRGGTRLIVMIPLTEYSPGPGSAAVAVPPVSEETA
ncbi:MAG: hypothetical protein A2147_00695 [Chloroflexi bacterium RBG_16_57_8]|nr:MAG: hypothetical protein A2147_00695 [Chloroflexi bacterium RBG_16_57_8]